jgi:hypothetical protein
LGGGGTRGIEEKGGSTVHVGNDRSERAIRIARTSSRKIQNVQLGWSRARSVGHADFLKPFDKGVTVKISDEYAKSVDLGLIQVKEGTAVKA